MNKVLILAYDFPPYVSVGGFRPYSWYTNFYKSGILPIVVTRQWDNFYGNQLDYIAPSKNKYTETEILENGIIVKASFKPHFGNRLMLNFGENKFRFIRRLITAFFEFSQFIFFTGNKSTIYYAADNYLKNNKVDVIIATVDPFVLLKYASKLSRKYQIPWIADYRDPWSQTDKDKKNFIQNKWETFFEKKYNKSCSKIISVSEIMKNQIFINKPDKFVVIKNGYAEIVKETAKAVQQNQEVFSIALAGSIYQHHPINSFLEVCNSFVNKNPSIKFEINFYGINIIDKIKNYVDIECPSLVQRINYYQKRPHRELIIELAKQNLLLLFNAYATTGTKIYEYIALKRKIIFCYSDDEDAKILFDKYYKLKIDKNENHQLQADIIAETKSGYIVKDSEHLKVVLQLLYDEFLENKKIECESINTENYSQVHQIKKLVEVISCVINEFKLTKKQN